MHLPRLWTDAPVAKRESEGEKQIRGQRKDQRKHTRPKTHADSEEEEAGRPPKEQQDTRTERQPKEGAPGRQGKTGRRRLHTSH